MEWLATAALCAGMLVCMTATALAAGTATLTIAPDITTARVSGSGIKVVYTISVTPPKGQEIGVFSFRLKAPDGMTLPTRFKEGSEEVIQYAKNDLPYNAITETGVFKTYEYTPDSGYFAAVGSLEDNRMTEAAQILTITATIEANRSGTFVLDAEFLAAKDGSGDTYTAKVATTPVVITDPDGGTTGKTAQSGTAQSDTAQSEASEVGTAKTATPMDTAQSSAQPSAPDAGSNTAPGGSVSGAQDSSALNANGTLGIQEQPEEAVSVSPTGAAAVVLGVVAAAGMLCQLLLPGGIAGLLRRKK